MPAVARTTLGALRTSAVGGASPCATRRAGGFTEAGSGGTPSVLQTLRMALTGPAGDR